jgi:hypothetical protein
MMVDPLGRAQFYKCVNLVDFPLTNFFISLTFWQRLQEVYQQLLVQQQERQPQVLQGRQPEE